MGHSTDVRCLEKKGSIMGELERLFRPHVEPVVTKALEKMEGDALTGLPSFRERLKYIARDLHATVLMYLVGVLMSGRVLPQRRSEWIRIGILTAVDNFVREWIDHLRSYCYQSEKSDKGFAFNPAKLDDAMMPAGFSDERWPQNYLCQGLGISMDDTLSILRAVRQSLPAGKSCPEAALRILELNGHKVVHK